MKVLQISSEVNSGSVGRIAEQIGEMVIEKGWDSYIAYARDNQPSKSITIKIGSKFSLMAHGLLTRVTDRHGFGSKAATEDLIQKINYIKPDLIQLQHLHGYFINIELLFDFLAKSNIPVVWTFHDCWSFTGHCAHYEFINCQKWQTQCQKCPQIHEYPKSFVDNSYENYNKKKQIFNSVENMTIVPVSSWLRHETKKSFLNGKKIKVIQNGIDIEKFNLRPNNQIKERYKLRNKFLILGVASPWTDRKGLKYFVELSKRLNPTDYQIILVGLTKQEIAKLPSDIIGIERTESVADLADLYSVANVFINPTLEDTFPTTNLEALACGTPVVTFKSGGSPEAVCEETGIVVKKGDIDGLENAIYRINKKSKEYYQKVCRQRAEKYFDKKKCFSEYIKLYQEILNQK